MEKMTAIIIEDGLTWQKKLKEILEQNFSDKVELLGIADSVDEGIKLVEDLNPELLLLDIKIRGGTSFDILKQVAWSFKRVIFISSYPEYLREAAWEAKAFYLGFIEKDLSIFEKELTHLLDSYKDYQEIEMPSKGMLDVLYKLLMKGPGHNSRDLATFLDILKKQLPNAPSSIVLGDHQNRLHRYDFDQIVTFEKAQINKEEKTVLRLIKGTEIIETHYHIQEFKKSNKLPENQFFCYRERLKENISAGFINRKYIQYAEKFYKDKGKGKNFEFDLKIEGGLFRIVPVNRSKEFEKWYNEH